MMDTITPPKYILDQVKNKFGSTIIWKNIEIEMARLCSNIPVVRDDKTKEQAISILNQIKSHLIEQGAEPDDCDFLDEEIKMYNQNKQISLYDPGELTVDRETVIRFVENSNLKEGLIATNKPFNWEQVRQLVQTIFQQKDLVKFFITPEKTMVGQIVAMIYENPQEIPLCTVVRSKKENEDGTPKAQDILLFGDKLDKTKWSTLKEINHKYYMYKFIDDNNIDHILLTEEFLPVGEYVVKGLTTKVTDHKRVSDSLKIKTKTPYIFAFQISNRVLKFNSHQEFSKRLNLLDITKARLFDFPFTNKANRVLLQPDWFKWLMWGWLAHSKGGMTGFNQYPLHILIIGPQNSGKSELMNALHRRSKEKRIVFSGSSSTLKRLIPSFKNTPAQVGYLAESNRFAFLDELFRCMMNTQGKEGARDEAVALMNDLLEHQRREAGSGISSVHVNMTARTIATTNPIKEVHGVQDILKKFDNSFLSRWLIYWQDDNHIDMIRTAEQEELHEHHFNIQDNDWVSLLDYLHSFKAELDNKRVMQIYNSVLPILSKELKGLYMSRHKHHILCIADGIIKARCTFENDMEFKAKDEDYEILDIVWKKVIRSWINIDDLKELEPKERLKYLPEDALWLYEKICEKKRPLNNVEIEDIVIPELGKSQGYITYQILTSQEVVKFRDDGLSVPYWWGDEDDKERT